VYVCVCVCVCVCVWLTHVHTHGLIYARMYGMNTAHAYIVRFGARLPLLPRKRDIMLSDAEIERAND